VVWCARFRVSRHVKVKPEPKLEHLPPSFLDRHVLNFLTKNPSLTRTQEGGLFLDSWRFSSRHYASPRGHPPTEQTAHESSWPPGFLTQSLVSLFSWHLAVPEHYSTGPFSVADSFRFRSFGIPRHRHTALSPIFSSPTNSVLPRRVFVSSRDFPFRDSSMTPLLNFFAEFLSRSHVCTLTFHRKDL